MRKFFAIALALCLSFSITIPAFAAEIGSNKREVQLRREVNRIVEEIPGAVVRVQDDVIHIAVSSPEQIPNFASNTRTTSVISSTGGSYRSFIVAPLADFSPYSQVYMSKSVTKGLEYRFDNPDKATEIIQMIADGMATAAITIYVKSLAAEYDMNEEDVEPIIDGLRYLVYVGFIDLEHTVFDIALRSSTTGKVSLVRGINYNGYTQYFYYPWNDNVCSTYNGYNATWFPGVYDV